MYTFFFSCVLFLEAILDICFHEEVKILADKRKILSKYGNFGQRCSCLILLYFQISVDYMAFKNVSKKLI